MSNIISEKQCILMVTQPPTVKEIVSNVIAESGIHYSITWFLILHCLIVLWLYIICTTCEALDSDFTQCETFFFCSNTKKKWLDMTHKTLQHWVQIIFGELSASKPIFSGAYSLQEKIKCVLFALAFSFHFLSPVFLAMSSYVARHWGFYGSICCQQIDNLAS